MHSPFPASPQRGGHAPGRAPLDPEAGARRELPLHQESKIEKFLGLFVLLDTQTPAPPLHLGKSLSPVYPGPISRRRDKPSRCVRTQQQDSDEHAGHQATTRGTLDMVPLGTGRQSYTRVPPPLVHNGRKGSVALRDQEQTASLERWSRTGPGLLCSSKFTELCPWLLVTACQPCLHRITHKGG